MGGSGAGGGSESGQAIVGDSGAGGSWFAAYALSREHCPAFRSRGGLRPVFTCSMPVSRRGLPR